MEIKPIRNEADYEEALQEIEAIEHEMGRRALARRDLEPFIGSRSRVWEVLHRKRPLTLKMIRALSKGLGLPAAVLVQD